MEEKSINLLVEVCCKCTKVNIDGEWIIVPPYFYKIIEDDGYILNHGFCISCYESELKREDL